MKSGRLSLLEQSQHRNIKCATYSVPLVGKKNLMMFMTEMLPGWNHFEGYIRRHGALTRKINLKVLKQWMFHKRLFRKSVFTLKVIIQWTNEVGCYLKCIYLLLLKNSTEQKTQTFTQLNGLFQFENICWSIISGQEIIPTFGWHSS